MNPKPFTLKLAVRDYECDLQGIVNNAVYLNYFEHARHEFLKSRGLDFKSLVDKDINFVAIKSTIEYEKPLRPGDEITITCQVQQASKVKLIFTQKIFRQDDQLAATGELESVAINSAGKILKLDRVLGEQLICLFQEEKFLADSTQ